MLVNTKTAYEMRISDWNSDVCSSDLDVPVFADQRAEATEIQRTKPAQARQAVLRLHIGKEPELRELDLGFPLRHREVVELLVEVAGDTRRQEGRDMAVDDRPSLFRQPVEQLEQLARLDGCTSAPQRAAGGQSQIQHYTASHHATPRQAGWGG